MEARIFRALLLYTKRWFSLPQKSHNINWRNFFGRFDTLIDANFVLNIAWDGKSVQKKNKNLIYFEFLYQDFFKSKQCFIDIKGQLELSGFYLDASSFVLHPF